MRIKFDLCLFCERYVSVRFLIARFLPSSASTIKFRYLYVMLIDIIVRFLLARFLPILGSAI